MTILQVAFYGHRIAIHTDLTEVIENVQSHFREMLVLQTEHTISDFEVRRADGTFDLLSGSEYISTSNSLSTLMHALKHHVTMRFINLGLPLIWFHSGAVVRHNRAVLFVGAGGRGKSTFVTRLCAKGWLYVSDDVVPIDTASDGAVPFPVTPAFREHAGPDVPLDRLTEIRKTVVHLAPDSICKYPMPIAAIVFPGYRRDSPTCLLRCSPGTAALELLQSCLNITTQRERAVYYVCDLLSRVPAFQLTYCRAMLETHFIEHFHDEIEGMS